MCDQMLLFDGIGDLGTFGEDFVVQSHQNGIKDHYRLRNAKNLEGATKRQADWEFVAKLPQVLKIKDNIQHKTTKGKVVNDILVPVSNAQAQKKAVEDEMKKAGR